MEKVLPQIVAYLIMIFGLSTVNYFWGFEISVFVGLSVIYAKQFINND